MSEDFKETEFNSSVATLKRIDDLMCALHNNALGLMPDVNNKISMKNDLLKRLYVEGKPNFNKEEQKKCDDYETNIRDKKKECLNIKPSKNVFYVKTTSHSVRKMLNYWSEVEPIIDEYEHYLVGCLDNHGMLMKKKGEVDETPDDW